MSTFWRLLMGWWCSLRPLIWSLWHSLVSFSPRYLSQCVRLVSNWMELMFEETSVVTWREKAPLVAEFFNHSRILVGRQEEGTRDSRSENPQKGLVWWKTLAFITISSEHYLCYCGLKSRLNCRFIVAVLAEVALQRKSIGGVVTAEGRRAQLRQTWWNARFDVHFEELPKTRYEWIGFILGVMRWLW